MKRDYRNPIFCALDVPRIDDIVRLVRDLHGHVGGIKLGLGFFNSYGPQGYEKVADFGIPIFLDLKLHDIPQTVSSAVSSLMRLSPPPAMLTLHALGGGDMLRRGVDTVLDLSARYHIRAPHLLAVTVLTSLDETALSCLVPNETPASLSLRLARIARESGCSGIVCSAHEIEGIRHEWGDGYIVVPGIRPQGFAHQDQRRISTPSRAIEQGADILVIGRPIIEAADPVHAADEIIAEIDNLHNYDGAVRERTHI